MSENLPFVHILLILSLPEAWPSCEPLWPRDPVQIHHLVAHGVAWTLYWHTHSVTQALCSHCFLCVTLCPFCCPALYCLLWLALSPAEGSVSLSSLPGLLKNERGCCRVHRRPGHANCSLHEGSRQTQARPLPLLIPYLCVHRLCKEAPVPCAHGEGFCGVSSLVPLYGSRIDDEFGGRHPQLLKKPMIRPGSDLNPPQSLCRRHLLGHCFWGTPCLSLSLTLTLALALRHPVPYD